MIKAKLKYFIAIIFFLGILAPSVSAESKWLQKESENFTLIYRDVHQELADHVLFSAENALAKLREIFDYSPSEKIIINTFDIYDYGFATATAVPQNYIRLEIEPFEGAYESITYNERIQWILSHELVHVVVNDKASGIEKFNRSLFSKVAPEQQHPITVFYSLLTNYNRYTPRWHQESIAVFLETWMNGGYGRSLSSFDEMFFRSMVLDSVSFADDIKLDALDSHNSFLLESLFYLYGTRFSSYLSVKYGKENLVKWYNNSDDGFYSNFKKKFKNIYIKDFDLVWEDFIEHEKSFQQDNINRLLKAELTPVNRLSEESFGWVSQPYLDEDKNSVVFGVHKPHHLAMIQKFDLKTRTSKKISSLPTPSMHQVASTAFDSNLNYLFFTTNNNQLYRDLRVLETNSGHEKLLFKDVRLGNLTVASATHELWGIRHNGGMASLMYSAYPYHQLIKAVDFEFGDEIQQLAVSPTGKFLAAIIHKPSGEQSLILINNDEIKSGDKFKYKKISSKGSPGNPSWSEDESSIFWNAFTNGVSNIYRYNLSDEKIEALSHTLRGLMKPIYFNEDSLFAFEFTAEGFIPVTIPNKPADRLPAINYLGQQILDTNPEVTNWNLNEPDYENIILQKPEEYSGLSNLNVLAFVPTISGFQGQKVLGFYAKIADPLSKHTISLEAGYSVFDRLPGAPNLHLKGKYEYKKKYSFEINHNGTDFYDLFNERKTSFIGTKFSLNNDHYWIYDNPLKVKQRTKIDYYTGVSYINDNLTKIFTPDFAVGMTTINSRSLRKSIGSSGYEAGRDFNITLAFFGTEYNDPKLAEQLYGDFGSFSTWISNHNVFHWKVAGGIANIDKKLYQGNFFFGGFGNRRVENKDVKQFRGTFRFPGIPMYDLAAKSFTKLMVENNFPPVRFGGASLGQHYLNHIDISVYSQLLYTDSEQGNKWIDLGAQVNLIFKHWFNLESTFSAGIAKAWFEKGDSWEWFLSLKLLRN